MSSLLIAVDSTSHVHLVIGSNSLAAARCNRSLEVGAKPILIAPPGSEIHYTLQKHIDVGEVKWLQREFLEEDISRLGRKAIGEYVDAVFVTTSLKSTSNADISSLCRRHRVPVNIVDAPQLCTFSLLSTHTDGPLQIGVTTNGKGCKLASRIRREISSSLPPHLGTACSRLGTLRRRIQDEDRLSPLAAMGDWDEDESIDQAASFNKLVIEAELDAAKNRRLRWLSQICEYWPLKRLSTISDSDVEAVLQAYAANPERTTLLESESLDSRNIKSGRIILAGSGPGHPDLLTRATYKAIMAADMILADKLVPSGVLDLIPRRTYVYIARKFPGNAERAQEELLEMGLAGLKSGKIVLRLKQGDPYIYGRGGEEFDYFRRQGFGDRISVLPGITSALSAPLFADIPSTHRGVSDQVLICTGTGRKGAATEPPEYVKTRTVAFLMALHRIEALIKDLTTDGEDRLPEGQADVFKSNTKIRSRSLWPMNTPCAVVERASCPDQRVIRTSLEYVSMAIEEEGSRPPGLLIIGSACGVLHQGESGRKWSVEEGFKGIEDFNCHGLEELTWSDKDRYEVKEKDTTLMVS